jgi:FADH2 O2-dependent halogenase
MDMARFMYWASRKGAPEWNQLGREFLRGILKAGVKARKVL